MPKKRQNFRQFLEQSSKSRNTICFYCSATKQNAISYVTAIRPTFLFAFAGTGLAFQSTLKVG